MRLSYGRIVPALALACFVSSLPRFATAQGAARPTISAQPQNIESILDQSYRAMYNLQFEEALRQTDAAKKLANDDPVPWMAEACAVLFREFDRLHI